MIYLKLQNKKKIPFLYVNFARSDFCLALAGCAGPLTGDGVYVSSYIRCVFFAEKLLNSSGREFRRALFSLKQIFQVIIITSDMSM